MKATAFALTLSLTATPALASNGNWQVGNDQIHVIDDTIDVGTVAGRGELMKRVERAAKKLCRDRAGGFRAECEADTIRQTANMPSHWGRALAIALSERSTMQLAAR